MGNRSIFRVTMLVGGFLAVTAILFSQVIPTPKLRESEIAKTEQSSEQSSPAFLNVPTEAIPGTAIQIEDSTESVVERLVGSRSEETKPVVPSKEVVRYLKILFRAIISPNAP